MNLGIQLSFDAYIHNKHPWLQVTKKQRLWVGCQSKAILLSLVLVGFFLGHPGTSLVVQCLRLRSSSAGGPDSILRWETKILHAAWLGQKKKRQFHYCWNWFTVKNKNRMIMLLSVIALPTLFLITHVPLKREPLLSLSYPFLDTFLCTYSIDIGYIWIWVCVISICIHTHTYIFV